MNHRTNMNVNNVPKDVPLVLNLLICVVLV